MCSGSKDRDDFDQMDLRHKLRLPKREVRNRGMGHGELLILDMRSSAPNNGAFQADGDSVIEPKIGAGVASHVESVFF